ncbi:MAG: hypothetical protein HOA08_03575 [Rhodospirillaceae bacterium]|jgi:hypothetical protein|nr:hypothetical protein [Rhodospirillaceae bacterium]MBT3495555.1 hypothetical protein [Rhodospirillaceae bacterium]MBT3779394.1 hypothetical protein [Rhodospirillaceae bacterium]MBT3977927.1 hypothetical protein [Rhodospirillaceae bacterium]MBT4168993.1 hypothetical protein [Rhodospirillaceae bacterium]
MNTTAITILLVVLLVILGSWLGFRHWVNSRAFDVASDVAKQVMPVWAAQGPFDNGAHSAFAMRAAFTVVMGAEYLAGEVEGHKESFDDGPGEWEAIRRTALEHATPETDAYIDEAMAIAALESLKRGL